MVPESKKKANVEVPVVTNYDIKQPSSASTSFSAHTRIQADNTTASPNKVPQPHEPATRIVPPSKF
ncbi:hypothetical protein BDZ97DRAFT_226514 [Flammula alnicola]|nr:hypothetical protein BDZ97DRAFT_226514 [Flammula alnicola]